MIKFNPKVVSSNPTPSPEPGLGWAFCSDNNDHIVLPVSVFSFFSEINKNVTNRWVWIHSNCCFKMTQIHEICAIWKYVFKKKKKKKVVWSEMYSLFDHKCSLSHMNQSTGLLKLGYWLWLKSAAQGLSQFLLHQRTWFIFQSDMRWGQAWMANSRSFKKYHYHYLWNPVSIWRDAWMRYNSLSWCLIFFFYSHRKEMHFAILLSGKESDYSNSCHG